MGARPDPVTDYARNVLAGKIVAGRLVSRACERHLWDLDHRHETGLIWDLDAVDHILGFFALLHYDDGPKAGEPFALEPFQHFMLGSIFGWKNADGSRRFRTVYCEIGKGNGKTKMLGGVALYGLMADGERAAEIYSAATMRDQANILFRDAKQIAEASPAIAPRLEIQNHNLAHVPSASFFRSVSKQHRGLDGKRVHYGLLDELHEHPDALVVNKIRAGTKNRRQPLIFEITNSGYDRNSVCWRHHEHSAKVLDGFDKPDGLKDDNWFAYVCQLDCCPKCTAEGKTSPTEDCPQCDDWADEAVWIKANPGLDTILPRTYLRERVATAKAMPADASLIKRLNFCIWVEAAVHAIPMDKYDACRRDLDLSKLKGAACYGGLDIGATSDFTAFALLFPHEDAESIEVPVDPSAPDGPKTMRTRRGYSLLPFYWLPERSKKRDARMEQIISLWKSQALIRVSGGDVVDYDLVVEEIVALRQQYGIDLIAFDRGFQGGSAGNALQRHFGEQRVIEFPQGIISMNAPFRELIELIIQGRIHHAGDPVTRWMFSNCAAEVRGGLMKPSKDHSAEKIDIVTAATMALGLAMKYGIPATGDYYANNDLEMG